MCQRIFQSRSKVCTEFLGGSWLMTQYVNHYLCGIAAFMFSVRLLPLCPHPPEFWRSNCMSQGNRDRTRCSGSPPRSTFGAVWRVQVLKQTHAKEIEY
jgi:hypothetical protein